jgi:hypothetical protein
VLLGVMVLFGVVEKELDPQLARRPRPRAGREARLGWLSWPLVRLDRLVSAKPHS